MVAVKRLHPFGNQSIHSQTKNRKQLDGIQLFFKQEASLLAKLNHPNVVRSVARWATRPSDAEE
jgi:hypothetical protein